MTETLIERLRSHMLGVNVVESNLVGEAADALAEAQARIARLELSELFMEREDWKAKATVAQARIARLERALEEAENIARAIDSGRGNETMIADEIARRRSVLFPDQEGLQGKIKLGSNFDGRVASPTGSRPSGQDAQRLARSGFDPSRAAKLGKLTRIVAGVLSTQCDGRLPSDLDDDGVTQAWEHWQYVARYVADAAIDCVSDGSGEAVEAAGLHPTDDSAAPQSGETPETCPADRGEWCPDPACLAKCKHRSGGSDQNPKRILNAKRVD